MFCSHVNYYIQRVFNKMHIHTDIYIIRIYSPVAEEEALVLSTFPWELEGTVRGLKKTQFVRPPWFLKMTPLNIYYSWNFLVRSRVSNYDIFEHLPFMELSSTIALCLRPLYCFPYVFRNFHNKGLILTEVYTSHHFLVFHQFI